MKNSIFALFILTGCASRTNFKTPDRNPALNTYVEITDHFIQSNVLYYAPIARSHSSMCTAVIVGKKTALTAAHCVGFQDSKPMDFFDFRGEVVGVGEITVFPKVKENTRQDKEITEKHHDLAVVFFRENLPSFFSEVEIANEPALVGIPVRVAGFGRPNLGNLAIADGTVTVAGGGIVAEPNVFLVQLKTFKLYSALPAVTAKVLPGDSGGPVYYIRHDGYTLLGLNKYSRDSPNFKESGHTDISFYRDWIFEQIEKVQDKL